MERTHLQKSDNDIQSGLERTLAGEGWMFQEVAAWAAAKALETSADKVFKERGKVASFMKSAWTRCLEGKTVVIITGLGGSGKSKIQQIISGELEARDIDREYVLSFNNERTAVKGNYFCKVYTRPGQAMLLDVEDNKIKNQITSARKIIVINVVSYGYNSLYRIPLHGLNEYAQNKNVSNIASEYLRNQRDLEIDYFRSFLKIFGGLKTTQQLSIVTVLNKMDLWWGERTQVMEHYEKLEYQKILEKFKKDYSADFQHAFTAVSLILLNLRTSDHIDLAPVSLGFDTMLKDINFDQFSTDISKLIG